MTEPLDAFDDMALTIITDVQTSCRPHSETRKAIAARLRRLDFLTRESARDEFWRSLDKLVKLPGMRSAVERQLQRETQEDYTEEKRDGWAAS